MDSVVLLALRIGLLALLWLFILVALNAMRRDANKAAGVYQPSAQTKSSRGAAKFLSRSTSWMVRYAAPTCSWAPSRNALWAAPKTVTLSQVMTFLPVITPGFSAAAANGLLKTLNPATAPSSVAFALTSRNELALAATSNLAARP